MAEQSAHDVHLSMAGGRVASGTVNLLQNDRRLGQSHANTAICFRDKGCQITGITHSPNKLGRVCFLAVQFSPILVGVASAKLAHGLAQIVMQC